MLLNKNVHIFTGNGFMTCYLKKGYETLVFLGGLLKSPLLLFCRLYWGGLFMAAGWEKLGDISHFAQLLDSYHILLPHFMAYVAALAEFIGGVCFILGFASRLAAIPLIITMITAYFTVNIASLHALFYKPSVFVADAPFNFLLASLLVLAFGPGRFSLDFLIERYLFAHK